MLITYVLTLKYCKLNTVNMDYNTITVEDITRLTDDLNTWSSTLCIPVNDSKAILDIRSNESTTLSSEYKTELQFS